MSKEKSNQENQSNELYTLLPTVENTDKEEWIRQTSILSGKISVLEYL